MASLPASIGSDDALGYWSPRTASVNWCEPDFVYSPYIAEFFNTISSLAVVLAGAAGLALSLAQGYRRRFALSFALMLVVGVGSVAFHGTLRREGQALDELPMVWATQVFTYIAVEASLGGFGARPRLRWLAPALALDCAAFAAAYLLLGSAAFLFFVALYIGGVLLLVALSCGLYRRVGAGARRVGIASNLIYAGGFLLLWLPDVFACDRVQRFSLHAWFHLTSTLGPWCGLTFLLFSHYQLAHEAAAAAGAGAGVGVGAGAGADAADAPLVAPRPELRFAAGCLPFVVLVRGERERERDVAAATATAAAAAAGVSPRAGGAAAIAVEGAAAAAAGLGAGLGAGKAPKRNTEAQD